MHSDRLIAGGGPGEPQAVCCGGFRIVFDEDEPVVRLVPGERKLAHGVTAAVLQGLSEAPALLAETLHLRAARRPYDRIDVVLGRGELTQGEAVCAGEGTIRLSLGEATVSQDAARIARHEALHLLLARSLHGGERWNDPEIAFADWIVRGIEGGLDPGLPRFHGQPPPLVERLPTSRAEVQRQLANVSAAPAVARRYFGEALFTDLQRIADEAPGADAALIEQRQLWLVEASLGTHYIEAAGRVHLEDGEALRPIVLDDWLLDYERYSRAVANTPSGAGNFWPLSAAGWSRDPLVRLSVAAQALQRDDHSFFAGDRFATASEPVVWKSRGRVRLPLLPGRPRRRPAPVHGFRAMLRGLDGNAARDALEVVEDAARAAAARFEARALWPRILARLLAAKTVAAPESDPAAPPAVQLVEGDDAEASALALSEWRAAADCLRALLGEHAAWAPRVLAPQHASTLAQSPRAPGSLLLVHALPLGRDDAGTLLAARSLAARLPVRGALFRDHVSGGAAHELLPDLPTPLDPRYREEAWTPRSAASERARDLPARAEDLPGAVDDATASGALTTPLSHLLAMTAIGLEECHYSVAR